MVFQIISHLAVWVSLFILTTRKICISDPSWGDCGFPSQKASNMHFMTSFWWLAMDNMDWHGQGWGQFQNWNWNWCQFQFQELELKRNWIKGIGIGIGIDKEELKEFIQFLFLIVNSFWFFAMFLAESLNQFDLKPFWIQLTRISLDRYIILYDNLSIKWILHDSYWLHL